MRKLLKEKYKCEHCKFIFWMEKALLFHTKRNHKNKLPRYTVFEEEELCPFYTEKERVCNCNNPVPLYDNGYPACPYLIDRPDLISLYRITKIIPGTYNGVIEKIERVGEKIKFSMNSNTQRFNLIGTKTTAFEIMKRTVSKDLVKYSQDSDGPQRVWNGFQFVYERAELMNQILQKIPGAGVILSLEVKENGIIGEIKVAGQMPIL